MKGQKEASFQIGTKAILGHVRAPRSRFAEPLETHKLL